MKLPEHYVGVSNECHESCKGIYVFVCLGKMLSQAVDLANNFTYCFPSLGTSILCFVYVRDSLPVQTIKSFSVRCRPYQTDSKFIFLCSQLQLQRAFQETLYNLSTQDFEPFTSVELESFRSCAGSQGKQTNMLLALVIKKQQRVVQFHLDAVLYSVLIFSPFISFLILAPTLTPNFW